MQPYGEAGAGAAYGGLDWGFIGRTAALVFATVTIALVVVVASLPWWDTGTFAYPLGNPFCHEQACGDYTDSASLRNVFPPTYGLVTMAFALSIFELVFLVGSITSYWNRVGILVTGIPGSIVLLVAPIYFYSRFPMSTYSGYLGSGWFMAFVAVVFFIAATIAGFFGAGHIKHVGSVRVSPS